jgi:hypothetical protein
MLSKKLGKAFDFFELCFESLDKNGLEVLGLYGSPHKISLTAEKKSAY